jgi:hypothetical protein
MYVYSVLQQYWKDFDQNCELKQVAFWKATVSSALVFDRLCHFKERQMSSERDTFQQI